MESVIEARLKDYFRRESCPISVMRVAAGNSARHVRDLTGEPHRHDFAELAIVTRGGGTQVIDDCDYKVGAGDVFLLQGNSVHWFRERRQVSLVNVAFAPERLPLPVDWLRRLPGYNLIFELEPSVRTASTFKHRLRLDPPALEEVLRLADRLDASLADDSPGVDAASFALLLELIVFVSRAYDAPPARSRSAVLRVGRIVSLLESEFARDWSLPELARRAAASSNTLLRDFRAVTGTSPIDYLIHVRLRRAAELLSRSGANVAEAAA